MHLRARRNWSSSSVGFKFRFYSRILPVKEINHKYWTSNKDRGGSRSLSPLLILSLSPTRCLCKNPSLEITDSPTTHMGLSLPPLSSPHNSTTSPLKIYSPLPKASLSASGSGHCPLRCKCPWSGVTPLHCLSWASHLKC